MTISRLYFLFSLCMALSVAFPMTSFAFGHMEKHRPTTKLVKTLEKQKQIPTSMKCQNDPTAGNRLKPQVTLRSAPNKDNRAWVVYAYYDHRFWMPGKPGDTSPYKKRYSKRLTAPASGKIFFCSLWVGPKGSLGKHKRTGDWARTQ